MVYVSQICVALLFTYFVLLSGACSTLLQCNIARLANSSLAFKHLLTYASFVLFVFVLDWYSYGSVVPSASGTPEEAPDSDALTLREAALKMAKWLGISAVLYTFFIVINKTEPAYFTAVLLLFSLNILILCFTKLVSDDGQYAALSKQLYITTEDYGGPNPRAVVLLHNLMTLVFLASVVVVGVGACKYYQRQVTEHGGKGWQWSRYIFGGCGVN